MQNEFEIKWTTLVGILNAAKVGYYESLLAFLEDSDLEDYDTLINLKTFLIHTHGELKIIVK